MAIKTNYNFKGIEVKDAYIRIDRLFGSSKEGWNSLVCVYNTTIETVEATEETEATTKTVFNKLEEFNFNAAYNENERGYVSLYNAIKEKYSGIDC
jgi:hypothetical protein